MKTLENIKGSILLLLLFAFGCQNESIPQDCSGDSVQPLQTFYSEFSNTQCEFQAIDNAEKQVNLVITAQADFDKYLTCSDQLTIDFDKYFILAGVYRHNQCAIFDNQQVFLCNNKVVYKVRMLEQDCLAVTSVFYATIIEKKYSVLSIEFDVQFKK